MSRSSLSAFALALVAACGVASGALAPAPSAAAPWVSDVLLPLVPGQSPNPVMPGGVATIPVRVTAQTGLAFTATPSIVGALPPGTTVAFSPPVVSFDGTHAQVTVLLLVYTTLATPENDYALVVRVEKSDAPGDAASFSGHLSVHRARFSVAGRLSLPGHAANENFGHGVESAGDFNADGHPDLMVSDIEGIYGVMGHVQLFYGGPGADGVPDLVFTTGITGDYYADGSALAAIDINGDGYDDIAIGAAGDNGYRGRVYIYYGGPSPDTAPDLQLTETITGGMFGCAVANVGDQDGDGYDDLLVGAQLDYNLSPSGVGHAYLYFGGPAMDTTPDVTLAGFSHWETFGRSVHGVGDVNGDGMDDFVVGAYWGGAAYLYYGSRPPHTTPDVTFSDVGSAFAFFISPMGDANGDGYGDVYLSQYYSGTGSLYYGGAPMNGLRDLVFSNSPPAVSGFTEGFALPDIDGDGAADLALGTGATEGGIFSFFRGGPALDNVRDFTIWTESPGSYLGLRSERLDGFFGDGRVAMALSAPYDSRGLASHGQVYVFSLDTTPTAQVAAQPPSTCVTPAHACVDVPVTIARADALPMRGYSVTVQLSANLALCAPADPLSIDEGGYLGGGGGGTHFEVIDNGGGSYTVDAAILGLPCGATAPGGTLFTLHVASSAPGGAGTVTVTDVTLRDCDNAAIAGSPGPPASVTIDNVAPAAIAALAAAQQKSGNDGDGTTKITLSWPAVEAGTGVEVWRKGFGNYPEYDDAPGAGSAPTLPAGYPPAGWTLAATVTGGATSCADEPAARDFWSYVAYVVDPCGNVSAVSNLTGGTLNYHLGDVHTGADSCAGDNQVSTADVSYLGAHYGIALAPSVALACLDVGPTTDYSVDARPATDNRVDFEDLMMFAINHGAVSAPQLAARRVAAAANAVRLAVPPLPEVGGTFAVGITLESAGAIQGLSLDLSYDAAVVEPAGVEPGGLLESQGAPGTALSARPGNVDVAVLGAGATLAGTGEVARALFRVKGTGAAAIAIARIEARDAANRPVSLGTPADVPKAAAPARTLLMAARPNPFAAATTLGFALAEAGPVELAIYSVDGRRVRVVQRGTMEPGTYHPVWDGRDERGAAARPGMDFARLTTSAGRFSRAVVLTR